METAILKEAPFLAVGDISHKITDVVGYRPVFDVVMHSNKITGP